MFDILGIIFIAVGLFFDFFGCLGLLRMPDAYNRLQASIKCITFGTCSILFGTFLMVGPGVGGIKALLCIIFIVLTAPVSAHAIARGAHKFGIKLWEKSVCDTYEEDNNTEQTRN
jgi:multicomponent Na+:H+ antiporter subunit G